MKTAFLISLASLLLSATALAQGAPWTIASPSEGPIHSNAGGASTDGPTDSIVISDDNPAALNGYTFGVSIADLRSANRPGTVFTGEVPGWVSGVPGSATGSESLDGLVLALGVGCVTTSGVKVRSLKSERVFRIIGGAFDSVGDPEASSIGSPVLSSAKIGFVVSATAITVQATGVSGYHLDWLCRVTKTYVFRPATVGGV